MTETHAVLILVLLTLILVAQMGVLLALVVRLAQVEWNRQQSLQHVQNMQGSGNMRTTQSLSRTAPPPRSETPQ